MKPERFYKHIYRLLDEVTPLKADCGHLCDCACCKGDEEEGMYLFPHEEVMYDGSESWLKIYDSDFIFKGKPVKIAICDGTCERSKRPLSCRIFPLFTDENKKVIVDIRGRSVCPLVKAKIPLKQYDPMFLKNIRHVFNMLGNVKTTREYLEETRKIIKEFDAINDLFSG